MILLNPWALAGLLALAAPLAAHLFARRPAKRQRFPTLRFLPQSRLIPARRSRLTDLGLLALRCAVIAAGVLALTQPACRVADRHAPADQIARAMVIDTSASMSRESQPGVRALDAARRAAADLAASATRSRVVESETPIDVIGACATWLAALPMRREIVVISDFQRGQIDAADLARIPGGIGVRPVQIAVQGPVAVVPPASRAEPGVTILASDAERAGAEAAWQAAVARGAPVSSSTERPIAIAFAGYQPRRAIVADGKPFDQPWMFEAIAAIRRDPLSHLYERDLSWTTGSVDGRTRVVLIADMAPESVAAAALLGAAARAASADPPATELSADVVAPDEVAKWARDASPPGSPRHDDLTSQGGWLWAMAVILLLLEGLLRRSKTSRTTEVHVERAA